MTLLKKLALLKEGIILLQIKGYITQDEREEVENFIFDIEELIVLLPLEDEDP